jgi:hypothetical protein
MSPDENVRSLAEDLLARAADDWVTAAEVIDLVRGSGLTDPDDLRDLAVGLVARLITTGLVVAGEYDGTGHRPWECSAESAIGRIVEEWSSRRDPFVMPGEIVWLDATSEGQRIGERVLAREAERSDRRGGSA